MGSITTTAMLQSCRWCFAIAFALLIVACEKEEFPIVIEDEEEDEEVFDTTSYEIHEVEFAMGENYETQLWYDLESNTIVKIGDRLAWDIAFDGEDGQHWITLNSSVGMMAANSGSTDFNAVTSDAGLSYRADHPWRFTDSLSLGDWWNNTTVWVIDLGFKTDGTSRGKRKVLFSLLDDGSLQLRWANLNGNSEQTGTISKNSAYNRIGFSFSEGNEITFEPMKTEYDLFFTRYHNIFHDPYQPYLVVGVLLNPFATLAAEEWKTDFDDIDTLLTDNMVFSDTADIIGYDWKFFNLENNFFTVYPDRNFLVKDQNDLLFKLRFLDFYNRDGVKGYPQMELQRLK